MASDVLWLEAVGSEKAGSRLFRRGDTLNGWRQVGFLSVVPRGRRDLDGKRESFCHCQVLTLV